MKVNDPLDEGQTDAAATTALFELFEQAENLMGAFRVDAYAVVAHPDDRPTATTRVDFGHLILPNLTPLPGTDLDPRPRLLTHELDRIVDQILEDLQETKAIAANDR